MRDTRVLECLMIYSTFKISGLTINSDEVNEGKILAHSFVFCLYSAEIHTLTFFPPLF